MRDKQFSTINRCEAESRKFGGVAYSTAGENTVVVKPLISEDVGLLFERDTG